jgi:pheromone shutdown protein TraB
LEVIVKLLSYFKKKYPGLFKVLVHERDVHIAAVVRNFQKKMPDDKVLLVIGAGHVQGVRNILNKPSV